ncbi:hypothetical protein G7054_g3329 [Neopestalotiopsis clavispora]|nr:hypothetical protein G7054_g3329 [Neopestalotiopsis clavispora]
MPARWAAALPTHLLSPCTTTTTGLISAASSRILITQSGSALLPRTARRGVKYGWSTRPTQDKPTRFNQVSSGLPMPTAGPAAALERKRATTPLRTGVLATKKGVSAMYVAGRRVPCTILQMDQCEVVANKTRAGNGYWAVQLGCGLKRPGNETAPMLGYYEAKGLAPKRHLAEFKVRDRDGLLPVGVQLQPDWFKLGQFVDAAATRGAWASPANHRTIGTTGPSQGGGSRVHPGKKMPGRMGGERVTVQNLKVLKVDNEMGIVVIKGHVAGPKGCLVKLSDAIKKDAPVQTFIDKARRITLDRNPDAEQKLEEARVRHLELKDMRKEGTIGGAALMD